MISSTAVTSDVLRRLALPQPKEGSKDERGCVLIVGGSVEVPGAVILAATAALRAGAGKLQVATVATVAAYIGVALPEAMVIGLAETSDGGIDPHSAEDRLRPQAERCDALLIGPGMTESHASTALTIALVSGVSSRSLVLDAASLIDLRPHAETLRACEGRAVITPHAGEMAQLLDRSRDEVEADPQGSARAAAELLQSVVVMKGAQTHIVEPQGTAWTYEGGGVGLATSGSGDILAGIIAGFLARGASPSQAALWGVFVHGEAGRRLMLACGSVGFLARELAGEVPLILRDVQAGL